MLHLNENYKKPLLEVESIMVDSVSSRNTDFLFEWDGTVYSSDLIDDGDGLYDVYKVIIRLKDRTDEFVMLHIMDCIYMGSVVPIVRSLVEAIIPKTNLEDELISWCEEQTKSVLDRCKVV